MQLADLVRVYPGVLSPEQCQELVHGFCDRSDHHLIHDNEGFAFSELNLTQHWSDGHDLAFKAVFPMFERYSRDLDIDVTQWPQDLAFEELRIKGYRTGGHDRFDPHVDVGDHASARRFLAALLYLNDVEEGGETEFLTWGNDHCSRSWFPRAGTLLLFPPLWPWLHAGRPPISGPKYILTTYLHYV
jgi:hypothetical protein